MTRTGHGRLGGRAALRWGRAAPRRLTSRRTEISLISSDVAQRIFIDAAAEAGVVYARATTKSQRYSRSVRGDQSDAHTCVCAPRLRDTLH